MILGWVFGPRFGFNISSEDRDWFVDKHRLLRLEMAQDCEGVVRLQVCVQEEAFCVASSLSSSLTAAV